MGEERDEERLPDGRVSRREFLGTMGTGTLGAVLVSGPAQAAEVARQDMDDRVPAVLHVNGRQHRMRIEPRETLLDVLRERIGLTGTKHGCGRGECGACTVLVGGVPRYACLTLALETEGRDVTTVEGLMQGEELGPVQQAFAEEDAFQCGYCTPGQVMAAEGLLRANAAPSPEEVRTGMSGNLCRCGAYRHIFNAVRRAAELRAATPG